MATLSTSNNEYIEKLLKKNRICIRDIANITLFNVPQDKQQYQRLSKSELASKKIEMYDWLYIYYRLINQMGDKLDGNVSYSIYDAKGYQLVTNSESSRHLDGIKTYEPDYIIPYLEQNQIVEAIVNFVPLEENENAAGYSSSDSVTNIAYPLFSQKHQYSSCIVTFRMQGDLNDNDKIQTLFLASGIQKIHDALDRYTPFFQSILNQSYFYALIVDDCGKLIDANKNFLARMGLSDEISFKSWKYQLNEELKLFQEKPYQLNSNIALPSSMGEIVSFEVNALEKLEVPDLGEYSIVSLKTYNASSSLKTADHSKAFSKIIGTSNKIAEAIRLAKKVAKTNANVLIEGETGTGKELIAEAIHKESQRSGPFVSLNCGAITKELLQSELFGYEPGAFTGAKRGGSIGLFEKADGGSLFLDEIEEMPEVLQISLLRVLETHTFVRVGGNNQIISDVRIIAATNRSLKSEVENGKFRNDLYYRLNVFNITLPPLRSRKDDIIMLAEKFLKDFSKQQEVEAPVLASSAITALLAYDWPGNIRELRNAMESAFIICENQKIKYSDLPDYVKEKNASRLPVGEAMSMQSAEKTTIISAIKECHGNLVQVAKLLQISRSTLYRKLKDYDIRTADYIE